MAHLIPNIRQKFFDANGEPAVGWKLHSFTAGTSTPLATFVDATETTENTNPIILDANGECQIWLGSQAYKFVLTNPDDVEIWSVDQVAHILNGSVLTAKLANGAVTSDKLADLAVTTAKLNDLSVTTAKLAGGAVTEEKIGSGAVTTAKLADLAVTTAKIADQAVTVDKLSASALSVIGAGKNKIINGDFPLWSNGTSHPAIPDVSAGFFVADRWMYTVVGTGVVSAEKSTDTPSPAQAGRYIASSLKMVAASATASMSASWRKSITQVIEGYAFQGISRSNFVISFWVKSAKTGINCISLRNGNKDLSYIIEYQIVQANTWEKKEISVPPVISSGTWNYENGVGLRLEFVLAAGSDFHNTAGAWHSGSFLCTSSQVNNFDTVGNQFCLSSVQVESGTFATDFEQRPVAIEQILSHRYAEVVAVTHRGYTYAVTLIDPPALEYHGATAAAAIGGITRFMVEKRATPTVVGTPSPSYTRCQNFAVGSLTTKGVSTSADFFSASGPGPAAYSVNLAIKAEFDY